MGNNFHGIVEALKASLNWRLILRYGLVLVVYLFVLLLIALLIFGPAIWIVVTPLLEKLPLVQENPLVILEMIAFFFQSLPFIIAVLLIAVIVFCILTTLWESLIEGTELSIASNFFSIGKISFLDAWHAAKQKMFPIFKAKLVVGVLLFILYIVIMLPVILSAINLFSSMPSLPELLLQGTNSPFLMQMSALSDFQGSMSLLYSAITLFLTPFLLLIVPSILFENLGAISGLKRAWHLSKNNYLRNLVFIILIGLVEIMIMVVAMIVILALLFISVAPMLAFGIVAMIVGLIIVVILFLLMIFWVMAYHSLAIVKFYEFASSNVGVPAKQPQPTKPAPEKKPVDFF